MKQALQEFIFNINVPTRVGFQCPFSNLTFDIKAPRTLKDEPVIIGGEMTGDRYGDFQAEMDLFNEAFCEVMLEGDAKGRVFTFPIPTINVTADFDWDSPVIDKFMEITCKYGIPYFSNYINSDLSPEDALSMCCRLRLDTKELRNAAAACSAPTRSPAPSAWSRSTCRGSPISPNRAKNSSGGSGGWCRLQKQP